MGYERDTRHRSCRRSIHHSEIMKVESVVQQLRQASLVTRSTDVKDGAKYNDRRGERSHVMVSTDQLFERRQRRTQQQSQLKSYCVTNMSRMYSQLNRQYDVGWILSAVVHQAE